MATNNPQNDKNTYCNPTREEIVMGFVASCIEDVADRLQLPYREVFERMDKAGLIDGLIYPDYEALHSESRENLTTELIKSLEAWEKDIENE